MNMLSWWQWMILAAVPPAIIALYFLKLMHAGNDYEFGLGVAEDVGDLASWVAGEYRNGHRTDGHDR